MSSMLAMSVTGRVTFFIRTTERMGMIMHFLQALKQKFSEVK